MSPPNWVRDHALKILPQNKRVLAVEDDLDSAVYTAWLRKLAAAQGTIVSNKVVLVSAQGKSAIIRGLEWFRDHGGNPKDVYGLVDRDEWDVATVNAKVQALQQLLVNPDRHCLESYFAEPGEIAAALHHHNSAKYAPGFPALNARLTAALAEWVDHWSLWVTTNRTNGRLRAADYPGCFHDQRPIPPDADILTKFEEWAGIIDPLSFLQRFQQERELAQVVPMVRKFQSHVYAKDFYPIVVYQGGLQILDHFTKGDWMINLAEWSPTVPADIVPFLQPLLQ